MESHWLMLALVLALGACLPGADLPDRDHDGYPVGEPDSAPDDCDDHNAAVYPGAGEVCDGLDNDCDGEIDNAATDALTWYTDADGDGYGADATALVACEAPPDGAEMAGDCDDSTPLVNPGLAENCENDVDENCDGDTGCSP